MSWKCGKEDRRNLFEKRVRWFHSLQMEPLRPEKGNAPETPETSPDMGERGILGRIKGDGRSLLLLVVQIAALAVFVLILRSYYERLRTLDGDMTAAAPQNAAVAITATGTLTAIPSATPSPRDTHTSTRAEAIYQTEKSSPSPSEGANSEPTLTEPMLLPGTEIPKRLVIPSIDVDAPIVQGDAEEDLEKGVGHRLGSANPGAQGNMVLSAHNDIHGEIFRDLQMLKTGADVYVHTNAHVFHYVVQSMQIVPPTKVEIMDSTDDVRLTMITCHPYMLNTHRVVAIAHLVQ